MKTFTHLKLWTRPSCYVGATWFDYYPLAGQSRDSDALEESNFRSWSALLKAKAEKLGANGWLATKDGAPTWITLPASEIPNPDFGAQAARDGYGPGGNLVCDETINVWTIERSSHWAVGWVETLLIHKAAHPDLLALCEATLEKLENHPVLDEENFSELESEQANEVWKNCYNESERVAYIRAHRSQFEFHDFADLVRCVRGKYFAGYASELISR